MKKERNENLKMPEPIDARPERVALAIMQGPPRKRWRFLQKSTKRNMPNPCYGLVRHVYNPHMQRPLRKPLNRHQVARSIHWVRQSEVIMMMNVRVWLSALLISLAMGIVAGSAGAAQECPKGLKAAGEFRLFFGLADGAGKTVTEGEWQQFLADTITPRFRAGLTVLEGRGQWLEPSGSLQQEPVKVVVGAVTSDIDQSMKLVDEISAAFEARFGQDPVFRMWNSACAGIYQR